MGWWQACLQLYFREIQRLQEISGISQASPKPHQVCLVAGLLELPANRVPAKQHKLKPMNYALNL